MSVTVKHLNIMKLNPIVRNGRHVVVTLTAEQAFALYSVVGQANADGDHEAWLRSANAKPHEIKALRQVMAIVDGANEIAKQVVVMREPGGLTLRGTVDSNYDPSRDFTDDQTQSSHNRTT